MTDPHPPRSAPGPVPTGVVPAPAGATPTSYGIQPPAPVRVELVDQVAAVVLAVPGVAGLHGGLFGEAATYLPGRRVRGIRLQHDSTEVHLAVFYGSDVRLTAAAVRAALTGMVPTPIHVTVEDIAPAENKAPAGSTPSTQR
ncbi:hypothetical protein [Rhodococcus antarcticus]|uniref:hypothetical protein n=1 Tax=Rhodococcus antarcticus TaxID=2987751 RepID=UPI00338E903F